MYISTLVADRWDGTANHPDEVRFPTASEVERAVARLDGERHDLVTLTAEGGAHMTVGGGAEGRYLVCASFDNDKFHSLVGVGDPSQTVTLVVGGQEGDYPADTIVDREATLAVAKTFAESGKLDPRFEWVEQ